MMRIEKNYIFPRYFSIGKDKGSFVVKYLRRRTTRTILIILNVVLVIMMCGCSKKKPEIEVTKDNFSKFESSKFVKVFIVCLPYRGLYHYEFPINEPIKVEVIKICIKDANHTQYDRERFKKRRIDSNINSGLFVFETSKVIYTMRIGWDDKSAYGFWWESPELLSIFRGWGLFEDLSKADPNWPPPKWMKNPPSETDSNFIGQERIYLQDQK